MNENNGLGIRMNERKLRDKQAVKEVVLEVLQFVREQNLEIRFNVEGSVYLAKARIKEIEELRSKPETTLYISFNNDVYLDLSLDKVKAVGFDNIITRAFALQDFKPLFEQSLLDCHDAPFSLYFQEDDLNTTVFSIHQLYHPRS